MASVNALTGNFDQTDASSYATASISPTGSLRVIAVIASRFSSAPNTPTATGNGITWGVNESATVNDGSAFWRVTQLHGTAASPSSGAITFDFGGQTQLEGLWSVFEIDDTSDPASFVQDISATGTSTAPSATLGAFADAGNGTYSATVCDGFSGSQVTASAADSYTILHNVTNTGQDTRLITAWKNSNDTSVTPVTLSASVPWAIIASEFGATGAVTYQGNNRRMLSGVG